MTEKKNDILAIMNNEQGFLIKKKMFIVTVNLKKQQ